MQSSGCGLRHLVNYCLSLGLRILVNLFQVLGNQTVLGGIRVSHI